VDPSLLFAHLGTVALGARPLWERGADCQAVLMSIFRTLKQRGHDPIRTVIDALATYLTTGQPPKLPKPKNASDG
jgi:uncharacterized protein (UPF0297 family)